MERKLVRSRRGRRARPNGECRQKRDAAMRPRRWLFSDNRKLLLTPQGGAWSKYWPEHRDSRLGHCGRRGSVLKLECPHRDLTAVAINKDDGRTIDHVVLQVQCADAILQAGDSDRAAAGGRRIRRVSAGQSLGHIRNAEVVFIQYAAY